MRFGKNQVIFDSGLTDGNKPEEMCGYLWACDDFVNMTNYRKLQKEAKEPKFGGDSYINFYPVFDVLTEKFLVYVSMYIPGIDIPEYPLSLTEEESIYIENKFKKHYSEFYNQSFEELIEEWKERLNEK